MQAVILIPDITLVEIDAVPAQQVAIFFLERASAMVRLLRLNVLQHGLKLTKAHRERHTRAAKKMCDSERQAL